MYYKHAAFKVCFYSQLESAVGFVLKPFSIQKLSESLQKTKEFQGFVQYVLEARGFQSMLAFLNQICGQIFSKTLQYSKNFLKSSEN